VALRDNLFTVLVAAQELPARAVAYDDRSRIVGIVAVPWIPPTRRFPAAAAKVRRIFRVSAPNGATATAFAGRKVRRYRCWRVDVSSGRSPGGCTPPFGGPSIWIDLVQPAGSDLFVIGHAFSPVQLVRLEFADGRALTARPRSDLFVFAIPRRYLRTTRQVAFARGYDQAGRAVQREPVLFKLP
jgi:hypothetical protein